MGFGLKWAPDLEQWEAWQRPTLWERLTHRPRHALRKRIVVARPRHAAK